MNNRHKAALLGGASLGTLFIGVAAHGGMPTASAQGNDGGEDGIVTSLGSLDQPICGMVGGQLSDGFNFIVGGEMAGMLRYDKEHQIPVHLNFGAISLPASCSSLPSAAVNNPATGSVTVLTITGISPKLG